MKRINYSLICIALFVMGLGLSSCKDDEDDETLINFLGIWDLVREEVTERGHLTVADRDVDTDKFIEFFDNGQFNIYYSSPEAYNELIFTNDLNCKGTWYLSGYYLTLEFAKYTEVWDITKLTRNRMNLNYVPEDGQDLRIKSYYERVIDSEVTVIDRF